MAETWHYVRPRPDAASMVRHPETGGLEPLDPRRPYRSDDPLVAAHPEAFIADADLAREHQAAEQRPVEQATRAPGERRRGSLR